MPTVATTVCDMLQPHTCAAWLHAKTMKEFHKTIQTIKKRMPQGGDLYSALRNHPDTMRWERLGRKVALDVALGINYLHTRSSTLLPASLCLHTTVCRSICSHNQRGGVQPFSLSYILDPFVSFITPASAHPVGTCGLACSVVGVVRLACHADDFPPCFCTVWFCFSFDVAPFGGVLDAADVLHTRLCGSVGLHARLVSAGGHP